MDLGLNGKTALITGGATGIGRATARLLLNEGASVILVDLKADELSSAVSDLGKGANALQADLRDANQVRGLEESVRERFEMPDILVCAAGITGATGHPLQLRDADWHDAWEGDFLSVVRTMRAFVPGMERRGWGRVVVVTGDNAMQPQPEDAAYNVTKAGLLNFAKGMSRVMAQHNVLVNSVSPAFIDTPSTNRQLDWHARASDVDRDTAITNFLRDVKPYLDLKRRGRPEEVAAAIVFLCSELASFVVGANYRVDGGAVATMA